MYGLVKRIFKKVRLSPKYSFLKNVFNTDFNKTALLSYLVDPFLYENNFGHTNYLECRTIAEALSELGFNMDVVDHSYTRDIDYAKYSVIVGMGYPLERSFYSDVSKKIIKIFYGTGCHPFFSDIETCKKINEFYAKSKLFIPKSGRLASPLFPLQYFCSDAIIVLGNDFVLNTYKKFNPNSIYYCLPCFYYDFSYPDFSKKDIVSLKSNYLWFGGSGAIHKGLDTTINFFKEHKDLNLHICGNIEVEEEFWTYLEGILKEYPNIRYYGFQSITSPKMEELYNRCSAVISPSVSEGGAPAILNVVANGGVIPIVTETSGVNFYSDELLMSFSSVEEISKKIDHIISLKDSELVEISKKYCKFLRENYSYEQYKKNMRNILGTLLTS